MPAAANRPSTPMVPMVISTTFDLITRRPNNAMMATMPSSPPRLWVQRMAQTITTKPTTPIARLRKPTPLVQISVTAKASGNSSTSDRSFGSPSTEPFSRPMVTREPSTSPMPCTALLMATMDVATPARVKPAAARVKRFGVVVSQAMAKTMMKILTKVSVQ